MSFAFKGIFHKVIAIGLALSILIVFFPWPASMAISFWLLMVMALATLSYGIFMRDFSGLEKAFISSFGLLFSVYLIMQFFQFPGSNIILFLTLVPLIIFCLIVLRHRENLNRWISFMVIWIALALVDLVHLIIG